MARNCVASTVLSSMKLSLVVILVSTLASGQKSGNLVPADDDNTFQDNNNPDILPAVLIACLVRNKAHTLPYFLSALENLDYPQDRISIW